MIQIDTKRLEAERVLRGWSKTRLAALAGVDPATVSRLERGHHRKASTLKRVADVLGLRMEELLKDVNVSPKPPGRGAERGSNEWIPSEI
jgi:transcriptional regulator with XRE-family HTH domain